MLSLIKTGDVLELPAATHRNEQFYISPRGDRYHVIPMRREMRHRYFIVLGIRIGPRRGPMGAILPGESLHAILQEMDPQTHAPRLDAPLYQFKAPVRDGGWIESSLPFRVEASLGDLGLEWDVLEKRMQDQIFTALRASNDDQSSVEQAIRRLQEDERVEREFLRKLTSPVTGVA